MAGEDTGGKPRQLHERAFGKALDEFGTEIAPVGKEAGALTVRTARLALRALGHVVSGAEQVMERIEAAVMRTLEGVPENDLAAPSPRIALPALQGAVYASDEEEAPIREMFANLIAKDMTKEGKRLVHPSFVEIVKQMSTDDAKMLSYFHRNGAQILGEVQIRKKGSTNFELVASFLSPIIDEDADADRNFRLVYSLLRLGLIGVDHRKIPQRSELKELEEEQLRLPQVRQFVKDANDFLQTDKKALIMTPIGEAFAEACLG